jgi:hypothetical protein
VSDQFYSFERALRELKLKSEELKRLVSEDQIRAIRDKGSMKFRKEDVERLVAAQGGSEEELELSEDTQGDAGMQTTQLSDEDTLLTEEVEEVEVPAPTTVKAKATVTRGGARPARATAAAPEFVEEKKESKLVLAVAIVSSLVLFYGLLVAQSISTDSVTSLTAWLAKTK